jgi:hypothetical protein
MVPAALNQQPAANEPSRLRSATARRAEALEKIARKLRTGEMPPPGLPRPDHDTCARVASSLEGALDRAAAARPETGRVRVHRLNRTEYASAIRDRLALDVDARSLQRCQ